MYLNKKGFACRFIHIFISLYVTYYIIHVTCTLFVFLGVVCIFYVYMFHHIVYILIHTYFYRNPNQFCKVVVNLVPSAIHQTIPCLLDD